MHGPASQIVRLRLLGRASAAVSRLPVTVHSACSRKICRSRWSLAVVVQRLRRLALTWLPLAIIVVIGIALSTYASFRIAQDRDVQARAEFERQAIREIATLKEKIDASFSALTALAALYEARGNVDQANSSGLPETVLTDDLPDSGARMGSSRCR